MMMTNARAAYMEASVSTADPARLLVMLCNRMVLDIQRGLAAQEAGDRQEANHQLVHAQAIVSELRNSLKTDAFDGGEQLGALYDHLYQRLVAANVNKDEETTRHCLSVAEGITETWTQAVLQLTRAPALTA